MNNTTFVFDIETGPADTQWIMDNAPKFNPDDVKVGNLKDPAKIGEKIDQARESHYADIIDKAALSAVWGRVLMIGWMPTELNPMYQGYTLEGDEKVILQDFWTLCVDQDYRLNTIVGFNSHSFDLPFLIRRSWILGVKFPPHIFRGRFFADSCIDVMDRWKLGNREERISLDTMSKAFGMSGKIGDGSKFHELYRDNADAAREYCLDDVRKTLHLWHKMEGVSL
jgi:hypothetical protein